MDWQKLMDMFAKYFIDHSLESYFVREWEGHTAIFVMCNDFFAWACADAVQIMPEDIELMDRCLTAGKEFDSIYGPELFCVMKRDGLLPQKPQWDTFEPNDVAHHSSQRTESLRQVVDPDKSPDDLQHSKLRSRDLVPEGRSGTGYLANALLGCAYRN